VENHVCLSRGMQVADAAWRIATRILAGQGDLLQRTGDDQAQVEYSMAGRLGGWFTPCAFCTVHVETRIAGFLVEPQNQGLRFISGLVSEPLGWVSWFGPQNHAGINLLVAPQNRWED
jgi:hypothetical protein